MIPALFEKTGAHVLVDGQYGSTGKGVLAAWLALQARTLDVVFDAVISNGGPNSGHTSFDQYGEKHVLKQIPTFSVASHLLGLTIPTFLSAGAVIDPYVLAAEAERYPDIPIYVHPNAAVITSADRVTEHSGSVAAVAGTRSGTGAVIARKVLRDPRAVYCNADLPKHLTAQRNVKMQDGEHNAFKYKVFVEVSQGYSLGLNQHFYPKVTSRECTVAQAIADAGIPPRHVTKTYMSIRTYPIRVGNVDGFSSGDWYPDQDEILWEELGVEPELTTVTQRVRRVATFSEEQFSDALRANDPDFVFINFMNYLKEDEVAPFLERIGRVRDDYAWRYFGVILGRGPRSDQVEYLQHNHQPTSRS